MRVDEVLAAAGSSKSQMYLYFADRDALVAAAVGHRCAEVLGQLGAAFGSVNTVAELSALLQDFAADYARHLSGCPIGSLAGELTAGPEPARQLVVDAFARWEGFLAAALSRIRANGELAEDADTDQLALALLAALEGGMFLSQVRGQDGPLRAALDAALAHLSRNTASGLD